MKKCSNCGGLNSNTETYCDYCSYELPKISEFAIKDFFEDNHRLFTILGIFAALSYYLISLVPKSSGYETRSLLNTTYNLTTTANTEILSNEILGLPSVIFLEFGILLSYLVFVGISILILLETLKYNKNYQRSIFIYFLCFLCMIVIMYSISILQTVIPFFIFITIIYGCGLLFSNIYDFILSRSKNDIMSPWVTISIPLLVFTTILISSLLVIGIKIILPNTQSYYPQGTFILNVIALVLLGLVIGLFIVGNLILMVRFAKDVFTYKSSFRSLCLIVFGLFVLGSLFWYYNVLNVGVFGIDLIVIGCVIIISIVVEKIRMKYSLKI